MAQQRLWLIDTLDPGSAAYNVPISEPLGEVDFLVLERTLNEILRRHDALRTCFPIADEDPYQRVVPYEAVPLDVVDLTYQPEEDRRQHLELLMRARSQHSFDLVYGPLYQFQLVRLAENDHLLLVNFHHIITDDWSMNLLREEVRTLYAAFLHDRPSPLPEPVIQYADFAYWQRQWIKGEVLDRQLAYWRDRLADLPTIELPTDFHRPPRNGQCGCRGCSPPA